MIYEYINILYNEKIKSNQKYKIWISFIIK